MAKKHHLNVKISFLLQCNYILVLGILVPMVEQALARYKCDSNTAVRFKLGKVAGRKVQIAPQESTVQ